MDIQRLRNVLVAYQEQLATRENARQVLEQAEKDSMQREQELVKLMDVNGISQIYFEKDTYVLQGWRIVKFNSGCTIDVTKVV